MVTVQLGFCPFCRECFEGEEECPEHGLRLLPFQALPPLTRQPGPGEALPFWTWRHGRGWVALGAALCLLSFFLPLARLSGDVNVSNTMLQLAQGRAKTLWLVPAVACAEWALLYRRRTLAGMQSLRLAMLWLSLFPLFIVSLTFLGADEAARLLDARSRAGVQLVLGAGPIWLTVGCLLSAWGALILGRPARYRKVRVQQSGDHTSPLH